MLSILSLSLRLFAGLTGRTVLDQFTQFNRPHRHTMSPTSGAQQAHRRRFVTANSRRGRTQQSAQMVAGVTQLTVRHPLTQGLVHNLPTITTGPVLTMPHTSLHNMARRFVSNIVTLGRRHPRAFPLTTQRFTSTTRFRRVGQLPVRIASTILNRSQRILTLRPFTQRRHTIIIRRGAFKTTHSNPTTQLVNIRCYDNPT